MDECQTQTKQKQPNMWVHNAWFHLYEGLEYVKVIYSDNNQTGGMANWTETCGNFLKSLTCSLSWLM